VLSSEEGLAASSAMPQGRGAAEKAGKYAGKIKMRIRY